MKKVLIFLWFIPIGLWAQINESDTLNFKANLSLTGFYQGGNVETFIFRAKSDLSFKPFKKWVYKTTNSYVFQEFGKEKADEDILSLNFLYFNPKRKFYPLILGFISTNFRREIDLRYLVGGGVTYKILDKKDDWLKVALSTEYEKTQFGKSDFILSEYDGKDVIETQRATIWLSGKYKLLKDKLILSHESYYQPSLEDSDNYRWQADLGVEFPLWKYLNFKINYMHTFESIVIADQKRRDNILTFGFKIKSYQE
ncbi:DUF481 domain-containing protein [Flavobacteriaceae bacterium 14752]|uniref:DUF481 domain-containing protein n=1 Tax=Mesohalobacter salilacus TaxID=2491711 RepID=UPI000F6439F3|nr:DUF481 domain-containing protein [Flavobacteriaceae bacterium 14752]